jgi:hypothetical protein
MKLLWSAVLSEGLNQSTRKVAIMKGGIIWGTEPERTRKKAIMIGGIIWWAEPERTRNEAIMIGGIIRGTEPERTRNEAIMIGGIIWGTEPVCRRSEIRTPTNIYCRMYQRRDNKGKTFCSGASPIIAKSHNCWSSFEWTSLPRVHSNDEEESSLLSPCKCAWWSTGPSIGTTAMLTVWSQVGVNLHNSTIYHNETDHLSYLRLRCEVKVKSSMW